MVESANADRNVTRLEKQTMTIETLALYETGQLEWPTFSPRSRLYPLEPLGVGTGAVESLTSYLTRLAHAHGVTVAKLVAVELHPPVNQPGQTPLSRAAAGARPQSSNLNGINKWTESTITALEQLTTREDVRFLTMYPWRNVLSRHKLLHHHLTWCSACYHDWQQANQFPYTPLLWTLKVVQFCPRHQQRLSHYCPYADCHKCLPLINSFVKPGYCPFCKRWLGQEKPHATQPIESDPELQWQGWLTTQLSELLAMAPRLPITPQPHTLAHNIQAGLANSEFKSIPELARKAGIPAPTLALWVQGAVVPHLDFLLRLCFNLGWPLREVCLTQPDDSENQARTGGACSKSPVHPKADVDQLRRQLEAILADHQQSPCSPTQVAQQLGWEVRTLARRCPQQYQQLVERYRAYQQAQCQQRNERLEGELKAVLASAEVPPPSLKEVSRRLQFNLSSLRTIFPDLCRLITTQYLAFQPARRATAEAGLKSILAAAPEPPPSMAEVATQLGETCFYLYRHFPELCWTVTKRYRNSAQTRARRGPSQLAPCQPHPAPAPNQVRDQFAAIVAAEEQPPPTLLEVAQRLGCASSTLRKAHTDLCNQLEQQSLVYHQTRTALLEAQGREMLATNASPALTRAQMARQLGVSVNWLKQYLPALSAEVIHRRQVAQQAERQRRQAFLDQLIAENPTPHPSLLQVAQSLGVYHQRTLQRQFPEASQLIMTRYVADQKQARRVAEAALKTALSNDTSPPPSIIQVARQLGYRNSAYLHTYFPDLCHQLAQHGDAYKQQVAQTQLETFLSGIPSNPPPSLNLISQQLGYHPTALKRLCPELCQAILDRYQNHWDKKKLAVKQALEAVLSGERTPPPSIHAIATEFGYRPAVLHSSFPDLTARVVEKRKAYLKEKKTARQPTT
jgi:AraC-like DNA-binding protein